MTWQRSLHGVITIALVACVIASTGYFLNWAFHSPTPSEFAAMARPWIPTVQAFYDYKADHGKMPRKLEDLVPDYLPSVPNVAYHDNVLMIHPKVPHTLIIYSFVEGEEGWSAQGEEGVGPLPLPKIYSTHSVTNQQPGHAATTRSTSPQTIQP